ncbi:hypothetical protein CEUSTIGMA_g3310.t1 [Chlamydomonas eustigma]|uniref:Seipin n=1 Tax=Chlamydomonas eustigma TaxID=1157962 RepID=A0A250WYE6_9CHLO|nr:hypothetical protein CEUSTIGMA_g3310.t1 [Chlamydomonas eustigma]|eukprot:GAX75867.1 hypothetical protein CEUSTIGMA_g3310.t1 [Chlamydomonas eustigma]
MLHFVFRSVTQVQASAAACISFGSGVTAAASSFCVISVILLRHITSIPPRYTFPVYFDYSTPMATAVVDLDMYRASSSKPFLRQLKDYLYPDLELDLHHQPGLSAPVKKGYDEDGDKCATLVQKGSRSCPNLDPTIADSQVRHERGSIQYHPSYGVRRYKDNSVPPGRLLPSGAQVQVTMHLLLPSRHDDLFQLSGELRSQQGEIMAQASRSHMSPPRARLQHLVRHILLAPCFLIGLCSDTAKVRIVLFHTYLELEKAPLSEFRASLSARVGGGVEGDWGMSSSSHILPPPPVYEAHLELSLKMGLIRSLLYWLRPSWPITVLICCVAACIALMASMSALICALTSLFMYRMGGSSPSTQLPDLRSGAAEHLAPMVPVAHYPTDTANGFDAPYPGYFQGRLDHRDSLLQQRSYHFQRAVRVQGRDTFTSHGRSHVPAHNHDVGNTADDKDFEEGSRDQVQRGLRAQSPFGSEVETAEDAYLEEWLLQELEGEDRNEETASGSQSEEWFVCEEEL